MAMEERGDFVTIAADGHGAPAAAVSSRVIVEEKTAGRIGANAHRSVGAFDDEFGGGARNGRKKPFEPAFPSDEFQPPAFGARNQLVVAFGEAKEIVYRGCPAFWKRFFLHEGRKDGADGFAQTKDLEEDVVDSLRFGVEQRVEAVRAFRGDDTGLHKEGNELVPGKVMG